MVISDSPKMSITYYIHDENNNRIYINEKDRDNYDVVHISIGNQVILDSHKMDWAGTIWYEMSYSELSPSREIKGQTIYQKGYIGNSFGAKELTDRYVDLEEIFFSYPNVIKIIYAYKIVQIETDNSSCFFCKELGFEVVFPVHNRKIEQPILQLTKCLSDVIIHTSL